MQRGVSELYVVLFAVFSFVAGVLLAPLISSALTGDVIAHVSEQQISASQSRVCISQSQLRYVTVDSHSMEPFINEHTVLVEKVPRVSGDIEVGDIISFYEPLGKQNILHLVVGVSEVNGKVVYQTKGVANDAQDPWVVPFSNVKGVVIAIIR